MTERSAESLRAEERALCLSPTISDELQSVKLSPEQGFVLSRIDGKSTPRDILAVTPLDEEQTTRALVGLLASGLILLEGDSPANGAGRPAKEVVTKTDMDLAAQEKRKETERLHKLCDTQSPAEVLGVSGQAEPDEIKRAFREKILRFHPDRYPGMTDPAFRQKLSHLVAVATDAFNTLSEKATAKSAPSNGVPNGTPGVQVTKAQNEPESYDAEQHALELFRHAERAYELQDYWEVIQLCRQAVEIQADNPKLHFLLGRALLQNKKWRKEAGESLRKAAELDPFNPEYLALLGALYQRGGMQTRAKKVLEQVKNIDPNYEIPELPG
jgi:tetratricopeptide (TPR) repeat protein